MIYASTGLISRFYINYFKYIVYIKCINIYLIQQRDLEVKVGLIIRIQPETQTIQKV